MTWSIRRRRTIRSHRAIARVAVVARGSTVATRGAAEATITAEAAIAAGTADRATLTGFAGIDNELYTMDKTLMVFGDAKAVVGDMAKALAGDSGMH